jgi:hypothetical protein
MAKTKTTEESADTTQAVQSEREARWEAFLVGYEKQNPEKFAQRKAAGEFDKIPDSFA